MPQARGKVLRTGGLQEGVAAFRGNTEKLGGIRKLYASKPLFVWQPSKPGIDESLHGFQFCNQFPASPIMAKLLCQPPRRRHGFGRMVRFHREDFDAERLHAGFQPAKTAIRQNKVRSKAEYALHIRLEGIAHRGQFLHRRREAIPCGTSNKASFQAQGANQLYRRRAEGKYPLS